MLLAGAASTRGASHILLKLCELTLVEDVTNEQAMEEIERNLRQKLPQALPSFRVLHREARLRVVSPPSPDTVAAFKGQANPEDLAHLVSAVETQCHYLVTFNVADYRRRESPPLILKPGELLQRVRDSLGSAAPESL